MFERYDEAARRAVFFARVSALELRHEEITTADLLRGLAVDAMPEGSPLAWLHGFHPHGDAAWQPGDWKQVPERNMGLSANGKRALAFAALEAEHDHVWSIERHHLFRGLLRVNDDLAAKIAESGKHLKAVRRDCKPSIIESRKSKASRSWRRRQIKRHAARAATVFALALLLLFLLSYRR